MICAQVESFRDLYSLLTTCRAYRRALFDWLEAGEIVLCEAAAVAFLLRRTGVRRLALAGDLGAVRVPRLFPRGRLELVAAAAGAGAADDGPLQPRLLLSLGAGDTPVTVRGLELATCQVSGARAVALVDCTVWGDVAVAAGALALVRCRVDWCQSGAAAPALAAAGALTLEETAVRPLALAWQARPLPLAAARVHARRCVFEAVQFAGASCTFCDCTFVPARVPVAFEGAARVRARATSYGHRPLRRFHLAAGAARVSILM
jgi:hypothetical protein